jgi:hypothetical protein
VPPPPVAAGKPWTALVTSNVALAPLTVESLPRGRKKADPLDDDDSGPPLYSMVETKRGLLHIGPKSEKPNFLKMLWRRELGGVQKMLRWINDTAYLVSVPFLVIILTGIATKNRPLALFGATVAIALNIGRFATGLLNLILIHFKESLTKGILFLIPPITFLFIAMDWGKLKKATRRVVEPAITIGLVILAFWFVPWLRHGGPTQGTLSQRIRAEAGALSEDLQSQVEQAKNLDIDKLGKTAKGKLEEFQKNIQSGGEGGKAAQGPSAGGGNMPQSPEKSLQGQLKKIGEQIRQQTNEIQNQP